MRHDGIDLDVHEAEFLRREQGADVDDTADALDDGERAFRLRGADARNDRLFENVLGKNGSKCGRKALQVSPVCFHLALIRKPAILNPRGEAGKLRRRRTVEHVSRKNVVQTFGQVLLRALEIERSEEHTSELQSQ